MKPFNRRRWIVTGIMAAFMLMASIPDILIGAFYSHVSVGDAPSAWVFPIVGLLLVMASYVLHRSELNGRIISNVVVSAQGA
jgi:hypothetical protein